jgi:hypothetical protein
MCADGGGVDLELHLAVFGHSKALLPQYWAKHQSLMMAFIINDGPSLQAPPPAHARTHNNQMMAAQRGSSSQSNSEVCQMSG